MTTETEKVLIIFAGDRVRYTKDYTVHFNGKKTTCLIPAGTEAEVYHSRAGDYLTIKFDPPIKYGRGQELSEHNVIGHFIELVRRGKWFERTVMLTKFDECLEQFIKDLDIGKMGVKTTYELKTWQNRLLEHFKANQEPYYRYDERHIVLTLFVAAKAYQNILDKTDLYTGYDFSYILDSQLKSLRKNVDYYIGGQKPDRYLKLV
jgi:hypothetical protein